MFSKIQKYIDDLRGIIRADLFISIGGACRPAFYLKRFHLRTLSSPFDWMMCYKLEHIAHFLRNDGADFFADISEICKDERGYAHRFIQDNKTGMVSMHDFPREMSINECYDEFITKHKRRFVNLKRALLKAKHIVFVGNRNENIEDFKAFLREMQEIHSAKYTLINVRHKQERNIQKHAINFNMGGGNCIIEYSFNDIHKNGGDGSVNPDFWLGNVKNWKKLMRKMRLS